MPFALILIGAVLLVAGIRNTYGMTTANGAPGLAGLVEGDFKAGFLPWIAAIGLVGAMGYVPRLRPLSIAFMTLLLLVLVISHSGVFAQLQAFVTSGGGIPAGGTSPAPAPANATPPLRGTSAIDQINQNLGSL